MWLMIEHLDNDNDFEFESIFNHQWSTTDQLTTSQLDRSDEWWAIMGVTQ